MLKLYGIEEYLESDRVTNEELGKLVRKLHYTLKKEDYELDELTNAFWFFIYKGNKDEIKHARYYRKKRLGGKEDEREEI